MPSHDRAPRRILLAVWEITLRCNLACAHCGSRAGAARQTELTPAEALDVVRQLAALRVREVTLIGGEAYLRPDWDAIARAIVDAGMDCTLVTGGRGLDAALARRARAAGIANVSVSLDGLETTHDELRGVPGSFASALAAIGHLRAAGVHASVNTQINRRSLPELEALLDLLIRERVWAWRIQFTVAMGRAADRPELLVQPYELLEIFPRLARLKARCLDHGIGLFPGSNVGYFGPYEILLRGDITTAGHWTGCSAGEQVLGIESDGTFKGCPSLPTRAYAGGNVRTRPLREMIEQAPELRFTRDRTDASLWGFCRTCTYASVCRGGCTWTSHVLFGRPGNNPLCHHRALELRKQGLRERLVPVAPAPGIPFDHGLFDLVVEPFPVEVTNDAAGIR